MRAYILVILLFLSAHLNAAQFRWAVEDKVSYKVDSYVYQEKYLNSRQHSIVEIRNKALINALETANDSVLYETDFYYYERPYGATNTAFALMQVYPTRFWRDSLGRYTIDEKYTMPVVRDVPVFPEGDVPVGHRWEASGVEVHDLRQYGLDAAYRIPIRASYIYAGTVKTNNRELALFSIAYTFTHTAQVPYDAALAEARADLAKHNRNSSAYRERRQYWEDRLGLLAYAPKQIKGRVQQQYYWDIAAGIPAWVDEEYHFAFGLHNDEVHEFKGHSRSDFERIAALEEEETERIITKLEEEEHDGVSISRDDRGVVINLSDVLFDFDSFELKAPSRQVLDQLLKQLDAYKEYDILVEGHTDNTGNAGYNMDLSKKRAQNVAGYLAAHGSIDSRKISWIGHGQTKPAAGNDTPAGRARNRRVEIILLVNEKASAAE